MNKSLSTGLKVFMIIFMMTSFIRTSPAKALSPMEYSSDVRVIPTPISNEVFVIINRSGPYDGYQGGRSTILKVQGVGANSPEMLELQYKSNQNLGHSQEFALPGTTTLIGSQDFRSPIMDLDFLANNSLTVISFGNNWMLAIKGTGGSGENMFQVDFINQTDGFKPINGSNFYYGDAYFPSGLNLVQEVAYSTPSPHTKVIIGSGHHLIKVKAIETGHNMFALQFDKDKVDSERWSSEPGHTAYEGDQYFEEIDAVGEANVSLIYAVKDITFIGLGDGRMLKINGSGGTGHNMFNIRNKDVFFATHNTQWNTYLIGSHHSSKVTSMVYLPSSDTTLMGFWDGRMLRVQGVGGTGDNMFNVDIDDVTGFKTHSPNYTPMVGAQYLWKHPINDILVFDHGNSIAIAVGIPVFSHEQGCVLFFNGIGTGTNMFALSSPKNPCSSKSERGYDYYRATFSVSDLEWKKSSLYMNGTEPGSLYLVPGTQTLLIGQRIASDVSNASSFVGAPVLTKVDMTAQIPTLQGHEVFCKTFELLWSAMYQEDTYQCDTWDLKDDL